MRQENICGVMKMIRPTLLHNIEHTFYRWSHLSWNSVTYLYNKLQTCQNCTNQVNSLKLSQPTSSEMSMSGKLSQPKSSAISMSGKLEIVSAKEFSNINVW